MSKLRQDADAIIQAAITAAQPDEAVRKALEGRDFGSGRVVLVAAGKGAWQMANAASRILGSRIDTGIVITKYDHSKGPIANFTIRAPHPGREQLYRHPADAGPRQRADRTGHRAVPAFRRRFRFV